MNNEYELRPIDHDIINTEDPDRFIDLLNTSSFSAGNFGGMIPVMRHRLVFEKWLEKHDEKVATQAKIDMIQAADSLLRDEKVPLSLVQAEVLKLHMRAQEAKLDGDDWTSETWERKS